MPWIITKYLITSAIVVAVSELAKRSDRLGALLASLQLVTLLALTWLYLDKQPAEKITKHAWYTFWYVVPTLPMFQIGRAHVCTPVTNAQLVCRLLLEKKYMKKYY